MTESKDASSVTPYGDTGKGKKAEVAQMFDAISSKYDLLNHVLSMGIDRGWRRKAIAILKKDHPQTILDVATGTGDFAIAALEAGPASVTGVDISSGMLEVGRKKIAARNLSGKIELIQADSEKLPFNNNVFDAVTVAFGVRNFENLDKGLSEMNRVLKPGGRVIILEFSKPRHFPVKQLYGFYFRFILPVVGRMVSKDKVAYTYLPASVKVFPDGEKFLKILNSNGFSNESQKQLTFGIASIYTGIKKQVLP